MTSDSRQIYWPVAAMQCVHLDSSKGGGAGQQSLNIQIFFKKKIVWIFRHVEWMHMNSQNLSFDLLRQVEIENECPHIYLIMQV